MIGWLWPGRSGHHSAREALDRAANRQRAAVRASQAVSKDREAAASELSLVAVRAATRRQDTDDSPRFREMLHRMRGD